MTEIAMMLVVTLALLAVSIILFDMEETFYAALALLSGLLSALATLGALAGRARK